MYNQSASYKRVHETLSQAMFVLGETFLLIIAINGNHQVKTMKS